MRRQKRWLNGRNGSISEIVTLEFLCSGVERQAELIFTQIVGVFISQFGQSRSQLLFGRPNYVAGFPISP